MILIYVKALTMSMQFWNMPAGDPRSPCERPGARSCGHHVGDPSLVCSKRCAFATARKSSTLMSSANWSPRAAAKSIETCASNDCLLESFFKFLGTPTNFASDGYPSRMSISTSGGICRKDKDISTSENISQKSPKIYQLAEVSDNKHHYVDSVSRAQVVATSLRQLFAIQIVSSKAVLHELINSCCFVGEPSKTIYAITDYTTLLAFFGDRCWPTAEVGYKWSLINYNQAQHVDEDIFP